MNDTIHTIRPASRMRWLALVPAVLLAVPAAALTIAEQPLSVPAPLAPNIVLTLDDSGSMASAYVPDSAGVLASTANTRRFKSASFNSIHYDPNVTYVPPVDASGASLGTSFSAAWINGFDHSRGVVDLSSSYRPTRQYVPSSSTQTFAEHPALDFPGNPTGFVPAYYYVFDITRTNAGGSSCVLANDRNDDLCYNKQDFSLATAAEKLNFANWYSFYRTRNLTTVTAASRAFAGLRGNERVAWQALGTCDSFVTPCEGWDGGRVDNDLRGFQGTHKSSFYAWLSRLPAAGIETLLGPAMERAGRYFKGDRPYREDPDDAHSAMYACRDNYHVLMTDGYWTTRAIPGIPVAWAASMQLIDQPGNADSTAATLPDGKSYTPPRRPYADGNGNVLADIAFKYWAEDLHALGNTLIPYKPDSSGSLDQQYWNPKNDPATWQHMVNFTVGLGLSGSLGADWADGTYAGAYAQFASARDWPAITAALPSDPNKVYDLWHAALNSRGQFFSADDPNKLQEAFDSILARVGVASGSATALAANSTRLDAGSVIFQAEFNSSDWSGTLSAIAINSGDGSVGGKLWQASIPAHGSRSIYAWNGGGVTFEWASLSAAQQTDLVSAAVLNYLRGDSSQEVQNGGAYRNRGSLLADIVNSDPAYAAAYDYGYAVLRADYNTFVDGNRTRTKMLYVGANDGMLHAFNADTGVEKFAYVPNAVIPNLALLSAPAYTHRYYVDGAPYVGDAYLGGAWKTLLLGTTGAGGKAVFALDVTDPDNFDASKVLWEYTDADLGFTLSQPVIARMKDGNWYAVFGNGYNSANHHAVLFIVNLADGTLAKKFDLGGTDNGLATPALYDADGDRITDAIYAGDNEGNLWKIDVSNADPNNWGVAYSGTPLFSARDAGGNAQPITAPPELGNPPSGQTGVMVFFGSGRYFADGDNTNNAVQSLYGILDSGSAVGVTDRSTLQPQTILYQGANVRATSNSQVDYATQRGWYLDLNYPSAQGERVVSMPLLRHGRAIFTTLIPSSDPCAGGGNSWIMELDANSGSRLDYSVFDLNRDQTFDSADYVDIGGGVWVPVSGLKSEVGIIKSPTVVTGAVMEYKYGGGAGGIGVTSERMGDVLTGRVSWREILD